MPSQFLYAIAELLCEAEVPKEPIIGVSAVVVDEVVAGRLSGIGTRTRVAEG